MKNITREEALELWLTTLEQHPERQTTTFLGKTKGEFCCLGQLCHLLYDEDEITTSKDGEFYFYGSDYDNELLPKEIVEFMHFYGNAGDLEEDKESDDRKYSLADMNDSYVTWPDIAKFIRENPEKVFVS
jgi:hypothetical protein